MKKVTFKKSAKGWMALQLLSPRKVTTGKTYFAVSCQLPVRLKPGKPGHGKKPDFVKAYVHVPDYTGVCPPSRGVTAKGLIKTFRPTVVKYRWVHNGRVVGKGTVKVIRDKRISYTFKPNERAGWPWRSSPRAMAARRTTPIR